MRIEKKSYMKKSIVKSGVMRARYRAQVASSLSRLVLAHGYAGIAA